MRTPALEEAQYYFRLAYTCDASQQYAEAIELYRKSIEVCPTAEAYTFLGWSLSKQQKYMEAIAQCERAIILDPDFGNAYNDIGAYLIHLERYGEAVPWLELACNARRYNARHYPHFNLGRIYERTGRWVAAIGEYRAALRIEPTYKAASQAAERIRSWMN